MTKQTPGRPKLQKNIRILTEFYFKTVWVFKMIHFHWYWISLWYSSGTTITYYIVKCECKSSVATFILISNCITMRFHFKLLEKPEHGKINVIWLIVVIKAILFIWKILTSDPFLPLHLHDRDQYRRKLLPPGNKEWLYKLWKKNLKFQPPKFTKAKHSM